MIKVFLIFILFQSCREIGDMFENLTQVTGKYFLIENAWGGHSIGYQSNESYLIRGPFKSKVKAYAIKDSLLVMKYIQPDSSVNFYVLNMNKDNDKAKNQEIYLDTIKADDFNHSGLKKLNLKFKLVD
jgi:hypothetical protein